jgi:hypothetical protein
MIKFAGNIFVQEVFKIRLFMKKYNVILLLFLLPLVSCAQFKLDKAIQDAKDMTSGKKSLSNEDIISGLKEALSVGTKKSTASASKVNGFLSNVAIKIPFPKEAQQMEQTLRDVGMNKEVDDFIASMNHAAEEAAKDAAPIFLNAVKHMTITDGMTILKGSDTAATAFLRNQTTADLTVKFMPVIKAALEKVQVTKYWEPLISRYNKIPFVKKQNPNLTDYVNSKALNGLFFLISREELKIRKDPAARVTDLLKKVFGA